MIDIDKVVASKSPRLYKYLPGFALRYIKKIAHQDDLNRLLEVYEGYKGADFARQVIQDLDVQYTVVNEANLPSPESANIFVSNHPLGGLDGITLIDFIGHRYPEVKFIVNDLLMHLHPLENVFVPVNKHGKQTAEYVRQINALYESQSQILYFPAGLCSRKIKGEIVDLQWKKNFLLKAIKHHRNIVPIYFEAQNSAFFYRIANIRKALGIRLNLEMFFLSDEVFKQKGARFTIHVGKPIPFTHFDLKKGNVEYWTNYVRDACYALRS